MTCQSQRAVQADRYLSFFLLKRENALWLTDCLFDAAWSEPVPAIPSVPRTESRANCKSGFPLISPSPSPLSFLLFSRFLQTTVSCCRTTATHFTTSAVLRFAIF